MGSALLLSLAAHATPLSACEQVRAVRQIAQAGALDTATLDVIEGRMCDTTAASQPQRGNQLVTLHWLGFTDDIPSDERTQVQTATEAVCEHDAASPVTWPNGVDAHRTDGTFQKPDGLRVADAQSLVAWGCEGNPRACDLLLPKIGVLEGEAEVVAIISLAWFASIH